MLLAVGAAVRLVIASRLVRELLHARAVRLHQVDIVVAVAVRIEDEA